MLVEKAGAVCCEKLSAWQLIQEESVTPIRESCVQVLLTILRHSDDFEITSSQLRAVGCDPDELEQRRVLVRDGDLYRGTAASVFAALRAANGLEPIEGRLRSPAVPIGILRRGERQFPVVWFRRPTEYFKATCLGVRELLGGDGLIVVMPEDPAISFLPAHKIVVLTLPYPPSSDLQLSRALPFLGAPPVDAGVLSELVLGTRPPERHVVLLNGVELVGFQRSSLKFLRLVLLAAARKFGSDEGWIARARLGGDATRALEQIRQEFAIHRHAGLSPEQLRQLVETHRGSGRIRLAIQPNQIHLNLTYSDLEWVLRPRSGRFRIHGSEADDADGRIDDTGGLHGLVERERAVELLREIARFEDLLAGGLQ